MRVCAYECILCIYFLAITSSLTCVSGYQSLAMSDYVYFFTIKFIFNINPSPAKGRLFRRDKTPSCVLGPSCAALTERVLFSPTHA